MNIINEWKRSIVLEMLLSCVLSNIRSIVPLRKCCSLMHSCHEEEEVAVVPAIPLMKLSPTHALVSFIASSIYLLYAKTTSAASHFD